MRIHDQAPKPIIFYIRKWVGKELIHVSSEIQAECTKYGYIFAVLDPKVSTHNIDVEPARLNVHVDDKGIITRMNFG